MSDQPQIEPVKPAAGRSCEGCTLCCKLLEVVELGKPAATWCQHCNTGVGCRIYADRPPGCRGFFCGWLANGDVPMHWRPRESRMVIDFQPLKKRMVVHVDPGRADAWRRPPYHGELQVMATRMGETGGYMLVACGANFTMLLGRQEFPLGRLLPTDKIIYHRRPTPAGFVYDVTVNPADEAGEVATDLPGTG
jgi:hypothetical protein